MLLEMPQKVCGGDIFHVMAYAFLLNCPKIEHIHYWWFFHYKIDHVQNQIGKWGISGKTNKKKWGISRKKHLIDLKTRKEPKMNMFDFGAFKEKLHMLSHAKYLLQRLFGAFHDTPRISISIQKPRNGPGRYGQKTLTRTP